MGSVEPVDAPRVIHCDVVAESVVDGEGQHSAFGGLVDDTYRDDPTADPAGQSPPLMLVPRSDWPTNATRPRRGRNAPGATHEQPTRGSIHRRGDSWTVRWRTDTADGRKHHSKGGFRTKKEAQDFLTDVMAAIRGGVFAEPTKVTLGDFLTQRWLPARKMSLRPSTYASYQTAINRHVIPALGHVRIQQLSPDRLDRFYAELIAGELSPKTVRNIHVLLHRALRDAVRKNLVPRNVADAADPPKLHRANRAR